MDSSEGFLRFGDGPYVAVDIVCSFEFFPLIGFIAMGPSVEEEDGRPVALICIRDP
jgi:hypothetical protein